MMNNEPTITLALLFTIISVTTSVIQAFITNKRNTVKEAKEAGNQGNAILIKLEYITSGITEIKTEIKSIKDETKDLNERVIKNEQSIKSFHHRLDSINEFLYQKYGDEIKIKTEQ